EVCECPNIIVAHGIPWFWIDAPCLDRRNSVELQESITFILSWYACAIVCFAHLLDVPPRTRSEALAQLSGTASLRGATGRSRKSSLSAVSSLLPPTGPRSAPRRARRSPPGDHWHRCDVLTLHHCLTEVCVARRLSWASERKIRRVEDVPLQHPHAHRIRRRQQSLRTIAAAEPEGALRPRAFRPGWCAGHGRSRNSLYCTLKRPKRKMVLIP
ncbi:hypothetical protein BV20DRAFT_1061161, partial [Pilatotrama ljubarskyi]